MKEKTTDIDILEKELKELCKSGKRIKIEDMKRIFVACDLIENLIAENKELKEENEGLKTKLDTLIEKYKELKEELDSVKQIYYTQREIEENYIPKSKLKAKIEEVEQWGLYNMKIPKLSTLDERLGAKIGIKYVLQFLLGKE